VTVHMARTKKTATSLVWGQLKGDESVITDNPPSLIERT
jgi:hypothetical protein